MQNHSPPQSQPKPLEPEPVADPKSDDDAETIEYEPEVSVDKWTSEGVDYLLDETSGKCMTTARSNPGRCCRDWLPNTDDGKFQPWDHDL